MAAAVLAAGVRIMSTPLPGPETVDFRPDGRGGAVLALPAPKKGVKNWESDALTSMVGNFTEKNNLRIAPVAAHKILPVLRFFAAGSCEFHYEKEGRIPALAASESLSLARAEKSQARPGEPPAPR
jgi:hypothetical protein